MRVSLDSSLSSSDLGKLHQGKPHTSWQIAVAFCCVLPLTPEEICAKDVSEELSIRMLPSACVNQDTGCGQELSSCEVQPNHWSCGMHTLEADLAKRPWLGQFVAKQWVLPHCEARRWTQTHVCSAAIPSVCANGRASKGDPFGYPTREDEPWSLCM